MHTVHAGHVRHNAIHRIRRYKADQDRRHRGIVQARQAKQAVKTIAKLTVISRVAIVMLIGGLGFLSFNLFTNYQNEKATDEIIAGSDPLQGEDRQSNGGNSPGLGSEDARITDDGVIIPSTDRPTLEQIMSYTAPADQPKRISINGVVLGIVTTVDDTQYGEVGVPANVYNAAWYVKSSKPGEVPGSTIITGHNGFRSVEGVFRQLGNLEIGNTISITTGDDRVLEYVVNAKKSTPVNEFNMSEYLAVPDTSSSFLHLITCNGSVLPGSNQYSSRMVVSAKLIQ